MLQLKIGDRVIGHIDDQSPQGQNGSLESTVDRLLSQHTATVYDDLGKRHTAYAEIASLNYSITLGEPIEVDWFAYKDEAPIFPDEAPVVIVEPMEQ